MSNPDILRIRNDLSKARQRLTEMQTGARLPPTIETGSSAGQPLAWNEAVTNKLGICNGSLQWSNQICAREADIARLELEYVVAMTPSWTAAAMIQAMESPAEPRVVERLTTIDAIRHKLSAILESSTENFISRSTLKGLLQS